MADLASAVRMDLCFVYEHEDPTQSWQLRLYKGRWFASSSGHEWALVPDSYLCQAWYIDGRLWKVQKSLYDVLDPAQEAFHALAFNVLPYWNQMLENGQYSRRVIKGWSHAGATRMHGDVGNRCMALVCNLCHRLAMV